MGASTACGVGSRPASDGEPVPGVEGLSEAPVDAPRRPDDPAPYGECRWRHYSECGGERPLCFFSGEKAPPWMVCSQRCDTDADCSPGPGRGTAPVRCKPIIVHPPPPGACVLDCGAGQTCPDGMSCDPRLGICAHPDDGPMPV